MSSSTKRTFIVPKNLDLAKIAAEPVYCLWGRCNVKGSSDKKVWKFKEYQTKNLVKHFPKCYYFIHNLISRNNREHEGGNRAAYTNLNQEIIQEAIPESTYDICVSLLTALNIIECDEDYEAPYTPLRSKDPVTGKVRDAKCKGFRLTEAYWGETHTIDADGKIINRKRKKAKKKVCEVIISKPAFLYELDQLMNGIITVDPGAFEGVQAMLGKKNHKGKPITHATISRMTDYLEELSKGGVESFRIDNYGRLWSAMAHMQREARPYVRDGQGNPLWQLDFKSSYCWHLMKLIKDEKGIYVFSSKENSQYQYVPTFSDLKGEVQFLYDKCKSEGLYEYIARMYERKHNEMIDDDPDIAVQLAKDSWNQTFLNIKGGKTTVGKRIRSLIRELFPRINEFLKKRRYKLWIALMKSEAELVHHRIIARIDRELRDTCVLFAVHDSLIVDRDYEDQILRIMLEEATDFFGFIPRIKSSPLLHGEEEKEPQSRYIEELAFETK